MYRSLTNNAHIFLLFIPRNFSEDIHMYIDRNLKGCFVKYAYFIYNIYNL